MERAGIYFKLKPGKKEEYVKAHKEICAEMREVLTKAGIRNYSIWNLDDTLFAYYETDNLEFMKQTLEHSEVYKQWRERMEEFIYKEVETGTKEWFMDMVFLNEGN